MWVFLNDAMVSAVAAERRGHLTVRARCRGDLERAFRHVANLKVTESPPARDYRFRCEVTRESFAVALAQAVDRIDYRNFKDSVREPDRHDAYLAVWRAMYRLQERRHGPGIYSAGYHAAKAQSDFGDMEDAPEWTPPGQPAASPESFRTRAVAAAMERSAAMAKRKGAAKKRRAR